jgi:hypothetical protein
MLRYVALFQFKDFATEVETLVHFSATNQFKLVETVATTITSYAISTRAVWPFVSIPHFERRGLEVNDLSNSLLLGFSPYVKESDRAKWEVYANYMQGWIAEGVETSVDLHKDYVNETTGQVDIAPIHPEIFNRDPVTGSRVSVMPDDTTVNANDTLYLPVWQMAPAPHDTSIVHYNLLDNDVFERVEYGMRGINSPVLSEATDLEWLYGGAIRDDPTHPHSFLLQPVYEDFLEEDEEHSDNNETVGILGVVIAIIGWDRNFQNLLPPKAHGIIIVMRDTCGDEFTYQVNGADAIFLGYGDYHDPKYAYLEHLDAFDVLQKLKKSENHLHCEYFMHIFPSDELRNDYVTSKPAIYTAVVMLVFFATVAVFVLYDYLVNVRQAKVMLAAKKSNAVVASLFPKNVRDRIMQDVEEQLARGDKPCKKGTGMMFGAVAKHELKHFLDSGIANADGVPFDTKPIADLFPSTTISKSYYVLS